MLLELSRLNVKQTENVGNTPATFPIFFIASEVSEEYGFLGVRGDSFSPSVFKLHILCQMALNRKNSKITHHSILIFTKYFDFFT